MRNVWRREKISVYLLSSTKVDILKIFEQSKFSKYLYKLFLEKIDSSGQQKSELFEKYMHFLILIVLYNKTSLRSASAALGHPADACDNL